MTTKLLLISFLLITVGCSSKSHRENPNDSEISTAQLFEPNTIVKDKPRALAPKSNGISAPSPALMPYSSGAGAVINAALIGAAKGLGTILSSDPAREDLQGTCRYGDPTNLPLSSPCNHVKVLLIDEDNTILATSETNEYGEFRFYMPNDLSCYVQVLDRKGRTAQLRQKVARGATVSLFLAP
ncbi:MAG: hypothetical protein ACM3MG_01665 [Bacillota bacterium]